LAEIIIFYRFQPWAVFGKKNHLKIPSSYIFVKKIINMKDEGGGQSDQHIKGDG